MLKILTFFPVVSMPHIFSTITPTGKGLYSESWKPWLGQHIDKGPKLNNINVNPIQSKSQMEIENRC